MYQRFAGCGATGATPIMVLGVQILGDRDPEPPLDRDASDIARFRARKAPRTPGQPKAPSRRTSGASPERLARLKQQIANGEYRPDPEEIARKLLDNGF